MSGKKAEFPKRIFFDVNSYDAEVYAETAEYSDGDVVVVYELVGKMKIRIPTPEVEDVRGGENEGECEESGGVRRSRRRL